MAASNYDPSGLYLTIVDTGDSSISMSSLYSVVRYAWPQMLMQVHNPEVLLMHTSGPFSEDTLPLPPVPTHGSLIESVNT